jgi:hypothetical protein
VNLSDPIKHRELGETVDQEMKAQWLLLNQSTLPNDEHIADGMIATLISQGFSQIKIRGVLGGLGGHRMQRVTDEYLLPSDASYSSNPRIFHNPSKIKLTLTDGRCRGTVVPRGTANSFIYTSKLYPLIAM